MLPVNGVWQGNSRNYLTLTEEMYLKIKFLKANFKRKWENSNRDKNANGKQRVHLEVMFSQLV